MDDETTIPMPTPIFDLEATVRVASQATQKAREERSARPRRRASLQPQALPSRPSVVVGELTPTWRTPRVPSELFVVAVGVVSLLLLWAGVAALRGVRETVPMAAAGAAVVAAPSERSHHRPVEAELVAPTPSVLPLADEGVVQPRATAAPEPSPATRPTRRARPARAARTEASLDPREASVDPREAVDPRAGSPAPRRSRSNERAVVSTTPSATPAERVDPDTAPLVEAPTASDSGASDSGASDSGSTDSEERAPATPELVVTPDF